MNGIRRTAVAMVAALSLAGAGIAAVGAPAIFTTHTAEANVYVNPSLARLHPAEAYLPLVIGVVNNAYQSVHLTRGSFALETKSGASPAISIAELRKSYGKIVFDRRQLETMDVVKVLGLQGIISVPSNFYPVVRNEGSVLTPIVQLPRRYYTWDVLYFKRPVGLKPGDTFTVVVSAKSWKKPIRVKVTL